VRFFSEGCEVSEDYWRGEFAQRLLTGERVGQKAITTDLNTSLATFLDSKISGKSYERDGIEQKSISHRIDSELIILLA
jgi:hypothetical protein